MKTYVALLRGINVGGNKKVEMKKLKTLFESLGCTNVSTYINSGNALFSAVGATQEIREKIEAGLKKTFGFEVQTLVKTQKEMVTIAKALPKHWQNDATQKTDVAYLFPEINSKKIVEELPFKKEFIDIVYVKGALIWHVERKNYNKSRLNKIVGHKLYKYMTVRNVNTARFLANNWQIKRKVEKIKEF